MLTGWWKKGQTSVTGSSCAQWIMFGKLKPDGSELFLGFSEREYAEFVAKSLREQGRIVQRVRDYLRSFRGKLPVEKTLDFFVGGKRACGNRSR